MKRDRDELRKKPYKLGQKGRQKGLRSTCFAISRQACFLCFKFLKDYELAQDIAQEAL